MYVQFIEWCVISIVKRKSKVQIHSLSSYFASQYLDIFEESREGAFTCLRHFGAKIYDISVEIAKQRFFSNKNFIFKNIDCIYV